MLEIKCASTEKFTSRTHFVAAAFERRTSSGLGVKAKWTQDRGKDETVSRAHKCCCLYSMLSSGVVFSCCRLFLVSRFVFSSHLHCSFALNFTRLVPLSLRARVCVCVGYIKFNFSYLSQSLDKFNGPTFWPMADCLGLRRNSAAFNFI